MWHNAINDILCDMESKRKKESTLEEANRVGSLSNNARSEFGMLNCGVAEMEVEDPVKSFRTAQDFEDHYRKKKVKADENSYLNHMPSQVENRKSSLKIIL